MNSTPDGSSPDRDVLSSGPLSSESRLGVREWSVLLVALLGWMFDGMEMGLFRSLLKSP